MIWRLTYCNKDGVEARLDIIKGASTPVEVIEGTATPFVLNYKSDKSDKSGHIMSSSADISIFETPTFNIDNLKTSSETEIKVEHYINGVLDWSGFVIPDFFSKAIGTPSTVEMVASDRIGTLKSVTIEPTTATISVSDLFDACLSKTGLSLSLYTQLPFTSVAGTESILDTKVSTQRFSNTKNRSISCYDILKSLLVMTNSVIVQRKGQWAVINKFHLEQGGAPSIVKAFSDITVGGRKTIIPVASSVGVYQEFGGGRIHPLNYDYNLDLSGWTPMNGFIPLIKDKLVYFFDSGTGQPLDTTTTTKKYLVNNINNPVNSYLSSGDLIIPYGEGTSVNVKVNINAITGATPLFYPSGGAKVLYSVVAKKGTELKYLNSLGTFVESAEPYKLIISFPQNLLPVAITKTSMFEGTLQVAEGERLSDYTIEIRMYAPPYAFTSLINEFGISFSVENEIAKGNIYKTTQGSNYTKEHEIDTTIFGDYITVGLDGYFYPYLLDDTSSLLTSAGELTTRWTTPTDTNELPLLQHVSRQKSRMFRVAHDLLSIGIDENSFDPLTLYQDCNSKKYVVVSASYDFLRSELRADIQQIAYDNTIQPRDYIYSYFGEGESGISSVGGIASGSGGGGVDTGIIGGINDKINEVEQRVDDIKVGVSNLLRNTGFLGDFNPMDVDALTAVTGSTPINTNPLAHWVYSNTEVVDAPSRSGKGVKIGSIQQTVTLKQGSHVLSFWAKGNSLTVDLVESVPVSIDSEYKKYSFDITVANSGAHTFSLSGDAYIYEIMLSEGNADVSYSYSEEDDLKAIAQLQAINVITDAIKNYDTDILGGLILTSMIQLGKYKDGVMEKVNAGISGIYNNDNDPAVWAGGSMEMAIRTVQKFISNPNYQPTEAEWADMAKIVFTHGGDGFFRGYIYALGGIFRGRVETSISGNRIVIDPEDKSLKMFNAAGALALAMEFNEHPMGFNDARINVFTYNNEGEVMYNAQMMPTGFSIIHTSQNDGMFIMNQATVNPREISLLGYTSDGTEYNEQYKFEVLNNTIGDGSLRIRTTGMPTSSSGLMSGEWYMDGGVVKVKP